ncbi:MAG: hypothetical protein DRI24_23680 [Deltaproteobacteria bacterium]|nr:MAG: hypothetical protein DRI24_23680 [Deltaproteobacteria bacterium]
MATSDMMKDMLQLNDQFIHADKRPEHSYDREHMERRIEFINEEIEELEEAHITFDKPEMLDALVDIVVVAMGTAILMGWDFDEAWKRVHDANMAKEVHWRDEGDAGTDRDMPVDLRKPEEWVAPNHEDLV